MEVTQKANQAWSVFIHSLSEDSPGHQALFWALHSIVKRATAFDVCQVCAESLAPSIHWQVFKAMSTGFLLCFARGLSDIIVHNTVSGMYSSFFPPSPCPCSTIQLKLTLVSTLGVLALPDNHPTQNTQFQKRTKFH